MANISLENIGKAGYTVPWVLQPVDAGGFKVIIRGQGRTGIAKLAACPQDFRPLMH